MEVARLEKTKTFRVTDAEKKKKSKKIKEKNQLMCLTNACQYNVVLKCKCELQH